ncbi:hypothetical protein TNIN_180401 [Trichonephila inaurata madagascariensis]|uniref:Uncharacterized protein n=1 Tax=Trichonephila inaurata madagascariensis TaxID=2747483 RepID=A0A8X7CA44_9ARAC|nr:hypothetical protein TNIN_180401 [Trichonephila inaurata madagascariensis]
MRRHTSSIVAQFANQPQPPPRPRHCPHTWLPEPPRLLPVQCKFALLPPASSVRPASLFIFAAPSVCRSCPAARQFCLRFPCPFFPPRPGHCETMPRRPARPNYKKVISL